ncbi:MAG TPA: CHASE2 domain-containing protein, partial [Allocoleopsis sp.]
QLPEAEVVFLVEPERRELDRQLWDDQGWDILFFAGHSASYILPEQDQQNYLEINHSDRFTIPQFKHALRAAIVRGLQIAILNSCDGLGLARQLADLQLPQLIVMREAVPDQVAQEFLKQWLKSFAAGQSFYQSVRIAREQLQGWENEFPCASWLPVICQNPAARPLTWNELHPLPEVTPPLRKSALLSQFLYRCRTSLLLSFAVTTIVMILRLMGLLQPIELWAFDRLLQLRPPEGIDNRLLIVTITEQDIQQQGQYPLSDTTLLSALKILDADQPIAIGLDIYRDVPVGSGYREFAAYLQDNPRLITTCEVGEPGSEKPDQVGVPPPPTSPETNRSFSDISIDPDGIVRRHLFHLDTGESPCSASYALSAELAFRYLDQVGIPIQSFHGNLQLGNTIFDPLENHIGFYQTIDARGHQVLLNYRATPHIAREVTLAQVLNHTVPPDWVKGQIVLIGVTAPSVGDTFATPYGTGINRNIPGVTLHAVMVSHLIRVASGERSLLRFWQ